VERCVDVWGNGCVVISGATGGSYVVTADDLTKALRVLLTASIRRGSNTVWSGYSGII